MSNESNFTKQQHLISPKNDVVFQILFGEVGSENITKSFLEAVLDEHISKIDLSKNPVLRNIVPGKKKGILDVIAEINGKEKCNIEMQVGKREDIIQRILYYWSRTYIRDLNEGENYDRLQRTIAVLIADFEITQLEELNYITKWKLIETEERKVILTDEIEIDIIVLPKIYKLKETNKENKLLEWIYFLENPNSEVVKKIMENNEGIKNAKEKLDALQNDEIMKRLLEWEESVSHEEASIKFTARNEGYREGLEAGIKDGKQLGLKEGREEGRQEGKQEGKQENKQEIAKKMKDKGFDIEIIIELTGLEKEVIENL